MESEVAQPSRREAFRFWLKLGLISFGGPVAQIGIMHRELVEVRRWFDERTYLNALNFAILVPGPEALQLAVWLGWRMHGAWGGVVAALCFLLPSVLLLLVLSFVYALHGDVPVVAALLNGLKAVAVALIVHAVIRLAQRALKGPVHFLLAAAGLVLMLASLLPFPLIMLAAALVGAFATRAGTEAASVPAHSGRFPWRTLATGVGLWAVPAIAIVVVAGSESLYAQVYRFFTVAALVTFGGAYAILAWVNQQVVEVYGWISQADAVAGLALAETTPGPLMIVLQFVGFMTGWRQPGDASPGQAATVMSLLATWAVFLPAVILILLGAPYVERVTSSARLGGALAGMTAAVVGVVASLAIAFGRNVLFPEGVGQPNVPAVVIIVAALAVLRFTRIDVLWVIAGGALAGLALGFA
ncbi:MAG TPA: chromate efflux transporter [Steroidobacteraceae bacterium]|nr:chromate efflux transporter [Steroidobacteraceae bacterium]